MRTNGKVVQGEQRYLEKSGLSLGFRKAASKLFTHIYDVVSVLFGYEYLRAKHIILPA